MIISSLGSTVNHIKHFPWKIRGLSSYFDCLLCIKPDGLSPPSEKSPPTYAPDCCFWRTRVPAAGIKPSPSDCDERLTRLSRGPCAVIIRRTNFENTETWRVVRAWGQPRLSLHLMAASGSPVKYLRGSSLHRHVGIVHVSLSLSLSLSHSLSLRASSPTLTA